MPSGTVCRVGGPWWRGLAACLEHRILLNHQDELGISLQRAKQSQANNISVGNLNKHKQSANKMAPLLMSV